MSRVAELNRLVDRIMKVKDYWMIRALRAEGHDIPERQYPTKEENDRHHG